MKNNVFHRDVLLPRVFYAGYFQTTLISLIPLEVSPLFKSQCARYLPPPPHSPVLHSLHSVEDSSVFLSTFILYMCF